MGRKRKRDDPGGGLFITRGQLRLFDKSVEQSIIESEQVECLGMTFPNDEARRAYFVEKLRAYAEGPCVPQYRGLPHR